MEQGVGHNGLKLGIFPFKNTADYNSLYQNSLKIRTANGIFWISLGIFRDFNLKNLFVLFFKIES